MVPMVSDGLDLGGWGYVSMASAGLDWCLGLGGRAMAPMVPDVWIVGGWSGLRHLWCMYRPPPLWCLEC